jgi:hypothetical protein
LIPLLRSGNQAVDETPVHGCRRIALSGAQQVPVLAKNNGVIGWITLKMFADQG